MRLKPIENPPNIFFRIAYAQSRRMFGKVITPMKVLYARVPRSLWLMRAIHKFMDAPGALDSELRELVLALGATINKCGFCIDISRARVERDTALLSKLDHLLDFAASDAFSPQEKAALTFADELIRNRHVSDATFQTLASHFTEEQIVELAFCCAVENFYNLMNISVGLESDGLCAIDRKAGNRRTAA